jgi:MYXO-CTERM domain-containing protein
LTDNGYGSPLYSESFFLTATVVDAGVPEPSSAILWTLGGLALAALAAHRRKSIHTA